MDISVVVPTFNRGALIAQTLDRILSQAVQPSQVVVVDDGSTDDTHAVLSTFGTNIQVITIENAGDMCAKNVGLRAASGKLVAFCDSDDLWELDHLAAMREFWSDRGRPIAAYADFCEIRNERGGDMSKFDAAPSGYWHDLRPVGPAHFMFDRPIVGDLLRFQPFFPSCMVVDRDRFLALGGWDEGVSRLVGCDFATTLLVAEHPPIGVLRRPTVGIRKHGGNFSGDVLRMNRGDADVLAYVLASRPSLAPYAAEIERSIDARRSAALDTAFATGDFEAVTAIAETLSGRVSPSRRLKTRVARLPDPVRGVAWRALTRIGTSRAHG